MIGFRLASGASAWMFFLMDPQDLARGAGIIPSPGEVLQELAHFHRDYPFIWYR
jgi:hypothetical protein